MRYRWKLICIPEKAGMRQNRGASKMKIIGITGGIGTGKSLVLDYLKESYGAVCCQADEVAKRLQRKGTKCYKRIVEHFGEGILDEEGRLNRSRLAGIVFSNPAELRILNEIVHPTVKEKIKEQIRREEKKESPVFVLEAALLIEDHYDAFCDELWYIYTDDETRKKRLIASRGYDEKKIQGIFSSQLPSSVFFEHCDRAIDNCNSFEEACQQIDDIMTQLGLKKG